MGLIKVQALVNHKNLVKMVKIGIKIDYNVFAQKEQDGMVIHVWYAEMGNYGISTKDVFVHKVIFSSDHDAKNQHYRDVHPFQMLFGNQTKIYAFVNQVSQQLDFSAFAKV